MTSQLLLWQSRLFSDRGWVFYCGTGVVAVMGSTVVKYLRWRFSPYQRLPTPPPPRNPVLFGYFWEIFKEPFMAPLQRWINAHRNKTGKTPPFMAYSSLLGSWSVAVLDCDVVQDILTDPSAYKEHPRFVKKYLVLKNIAGDGLVTLEGKAWSRHRRIIQPAFQERPLKEALDQYAPLLTNKLVQAWKTAQRNATIDLFSHMSAVTLDVLGQVAFGHDFGGLNVIEEWATACAEGKEEAQLEEINDPMLQSLRASFKVSGYNILLMIAGLTKYTNQLNRKSGRTAKLLDDAAARVINAAREKDSTSASGSDKRKSLLQLLFKARDTVAQNTKNYLSDAELRNETKTFIVAGHETTSSWAYWALYALALHPEMQDKLYHDICAHQQTPESPLVSSTVDCMEYLDAFVKEVLRFYTPVGVIMRFTTRQEQWGEHTIPRNTRLVIPMHAIHRLPEHYENPLEFFPERWFNTTPRDTLHKFAFLPFSGGPRNCIGQRFAELEVKIILATIVRSLKISLGPSTEKDGVVFTNFIAMKSKTPIMVIAKERH